MENCKNTSCSNHKDCHSDNPDVTKGCEPMKNKSVFEKCKELYRSLGYSEEKDFPTEYYFMFNPTTGQKVRLYYNGKAFEGNYPLDLTSP